MTKQTVERAGEITGKLATMRRWLNITRAGAIRLRGTDWFSWATAGGSNAVLLTSESGVAEVIVTPRDAYVLTDEIEADRLRNEEVAAGYHWHMTPWTEPERREIFVTDLTGGARILSDRPGLKEEFLPESCFVERMALVESEQERYRKVGRLASEAMSEVMQAARPEWTEFELAGAGAEALWGRGLHPALTLAAGAKRLTKYRHPTPSEERLGSEAMMVFCARGYGLYANLTRFVRFMKPNEQQQRLQAAILVVEAAGLQACRTGMPLSEVYHAFDKSYRAQGFTDAVRAHHQGGVTGYAARELMAMPETALSLQDGMALAFNPSLPGVKVEDTFLMRDSNLENLTFDPNWPSAMHAGRQRPIPLEVA
jgi:Xaa-Pro aminopeptidase